MKSLEFYTWSNSWWFIFIKGDHYFGYYYGNDDHYVPYKSDYNSVEGLINKRTKVLEYD